MKRLKAALILGAVLSSSASSSLGGALASSELTLCECKTIDKDRFERAVSGRYGSTWSQVTLSDLAPDDSALWEREHGDDDPGEVSGSFDPRGRRSCALLLLVEEAHASQLVVLVLRATRFAVKVEEAFRQEAPTPVPVLRRAPVGLYRSTKNHEASVRLRHDGIFVEYLEAGIVLVYFEDGDYETMVLSE